MVGVSPIAHSRTVKVMLDLCVFKSPVARNDTQLVAHLKGNVSDVPQVHDIFCYSIAVYNTDIVATVYIVKGLLRPN